MNGSRSPLLPWLFSIGLVGCSSCEGAVTKSGVGKYPETASIETARVSVELQDATRDNTDSPVRLRLDAGDSASCLVVSAGALEAKLDGAALRLNDSGSQAYNINENSGATGWYCSGVIFVLATAPSATAGLIEVKDAKAGAMLVLELPELAAVTAAFPLERVGSGDVKAGGELRLRWPRPALAAFEEAETRVALYPAGVTYRPDNPCGLDMQMKRSGDELHGQVPANACPGRTTLTLGFAENKPMTVKRCDGASECEAHFTSRERTLGVTIVK